MIIEARYWYLEREDDKFLKFQLNIYFYFEISFSLKRCVLISTTSQSCWIENAPGTLIRGATGGITILTRKVLLIMSTHHLGILIKRFIRLLEHQVLCMGMGTHIIVCRMI